MAKEEAIEFEGAICEVLPNGIFKVKLDSKHIVKATIAGKMKKFRIRIALGDRVKVEVSPYNMEQGRIVYRER